MRVLFLGPYPPPYGGVQTHLVGLREFLRSQGVQSSVVNITGTRRRSADDVHYPNSAAQVMSLLWRTSADIIHLHLGGDLTTRLVGLLVVCSMIPRRRTVLTFHSGGYPRSDAGRRARRSSIRGAVFRRLDAIIAVNPEQVEMFQRFGVAPDRCHLIPPFAFTTPPSGELPAPLESFARAHQPLLVSVGLLEPEYDLPQQIDVLEEIRRTHPDAGLLMIGSGSLDAELRRLIATKAYADHMLLSGDVPHEATLAAIARATILLRTTRYDGDAISVREALHLGTPVIATDNGMRPPGVRLIPVGDLGALSRAIRDELEAPRQIAAPTKAAGTENFLEVLQLYEHLTGA